MNLNKFYTEDDLLFIYDKPEQYSSKYFLKKLTDVGAYIYIITNGKRIDKTKSSLERYEYTFMSNVQKFVLEESIMYDEDDRLHVYYYNCKIYSLEQLHKELKTQKYNQIEEEFRNIIYAFSRGYTFNCSYVHIQINIDIYTYSIKLTQIMKSLSQRINESNKLTGETIGHITSTFNVGDQLIVDTLAFGLHFEKYKTVKLDNNDTYTIKSLTSDYGKNSSYMCIVNTSGQRYVLAMKKDATTGLIKKK